MSGAWKGRSVRRAGGVLAVVALLVLAGCTGAGGGGDAAELEATRAGGAPADAGPDAAETNRESGDDALQVRQRQVIKTGRVVLTVDDYGRARQNLTRAARGMDGFVSDSTRERHEVRGGTYTTGSVTLRVPDERFGAMMDRAESMGTVEHSETNSKDVTEQLVDVEARLANLRSQRERLRTLYERANDTEDVLAVQRQLSETQERIERLEAQQRSLERQVAYSTITVELREERPEPGPEAVQQWYDVPLVGAFLESVHGVTVVARAIAVLAAYALPYVVVFLGPVVLVAGLAVRRYRRRSDGTAGEPVAEDGDGSDGTGEDGGDGTGEDGTGEDGGGSAPVAEDGTDADRAAEADEAGPTDDEATAAADDEEVDGSRAEGPE